MLIDRWPLSSAGGTSLTVFTLAPMGSSSEKNRKPGLRRLGPKIYTIVYKVRLPQRPRRVLRVAWAKALFAAQVAQVRPPQCKRTEG